MIKNWEEKFSALVAKYRNNILASDAPEEEFAKEDVIKTGGLPVYSAPGGSYVIDTEGRVLEINHATNAVSMITNSRLELLALVSAAEKYAEFEPLLPRKNKEARTCERCKGKGSSVLAGVKLRCDKCLGLGWYAMRKT